MAELVMEGECPDCTGKLSLKLGGSVTTLIPESTIKNLMDDDGNGFWCQTCQGYKEPENIDINKE